MKNTIKVKKKNAPETPKSRNELIQMISWLVGCFGFNGPLRQYFSLYRAVSQREGEQMIRMECLLVNKGLI